MFAKLVQLLIIAIASFQVAFSAHAVQEVEELAVPTLPDIAMVHFVPGKAPVIFYNPSLCFQAGRALCEFYRYHEYGHIALRHDERDDLSLKEKEREADRWAAEHAPRRSVIAAYRFFTSGGGSTPIHGNSHNRAARMISGTEKLTLLEN